MELSHDEVLEILDLIERTDVEYLELEVDGTRIVVDKSGRQAPATTTVEPLPTAPEPEAPEPASPSAVAVDADLVTVDAPVVGVFYRSPSPGEPPYVEAGSRVDADSTVGLVEVMKMFNSVTAGVHGRVVEILVGNEEFVEFGQPLMTIRPDESP